ncbi:MAG: DNA (cytosine-5-)-methyltransferase [Nocardioides sp.]
MTSPTFKVAGLFAGIGGIELGFQRALGSDAETTLLCEWWDPAKCVLASRFPGVDVHPDVRELTDLPAEVNVVTAGFPCTDLSQAGRTAGITGENSGLVKHVFESLRLAAKSRELPTLVIENVPNMLALNRGQAMEYLIGEIEDLGYRWAYRVVDSRFTGVPQRRRRVILVASTAIDPREVLFADDAGLRSEQDLAADAFGFYWTEGRGGLGWAQDAVPTLKGGSTIGIPSPPAVWLPNADVGRRFLKPTIEDAEAMQGFDRGWTSVEGVSAKRNGPRWKLVGNAVTVGVAQWVAGRLAMPAPVVAEYALREPRQGAWPTAAWGENGTMWTVAGLSEFPLHGAYRHLADELDREAAEPLSIRGARGFFSRLQQGNLGRHPGFREDVAEHIEAMTALSA